MKVLSVYSDFSISPESEETSSSVSDASHPYILFESGVYNLHTKLITPLNCVEMIASNDSICLAVTSLGKVIGWGEDSEGLLGQGSQIFKSPIELTTISSIAKLSLSHNHVAAISQSGQLFTWGSKLEGKLGDVQFEKNCPKVVPSAKIYEAISVVCGKNYTGILTSGGYLMVYGQVSSNHLPLASPRKSVVVKDFSPYSNPSLDVSPILQVIGTAYFIVAQLDSQELVVFDGCFNLVKFPVPESGLDAIQANDSKIIGITLTEVLVWTKSSTNLNKFECPVKAWKTSKYKVYEDFKIWSWGENFLVVSETTNLFVQDNDIEDYLVVTTKSMRTSLLMDSPLNLSVQSLISPQSRKESLLKLFPGSEGEKTIAKIMKCREEFSNRNLLKDVFRKIVHPIVKDSFFIVKEFAKQKKIFHIMKNTARFFCVFENLMYKKFLNKFFVWVRKTRVSRVKLNIQNKLGNLRVRSNCGYGRKMNMFCLRVKGVVDNAVKRVCEGVFSDLWNLMNTEKTLEFIVRRLKNVWLFQFFERWRKVYMSKLIFLKSLEEKSFFCVNSWIRTVFFLLIQEYQRKEIFVQQLGRAAEGFQTFLDNRKERLGFVKFKSVLVISKANKLKKQVLLKRLCYTLFLVCSSRLHNSIQSVFLSIKSYKKPNPVIKVGQKIKFTKNRVKKSQNSPKPNLSLIIHLLHKSLKICIDKLLIASQDLLKSRFYSFLFKTNSFIVKKEFVHKLTAMTCIKIQVGLLQSFNELANSDSNLMDDISNSKACISNSMHITLFDSSPKYRDQNLQSAGNSPRSIENTDHPTYFRTGELLSYQKYLINKKRLEMIKEDNSFCENGKICIQKGGKKKKKSKNLRPPWKPSSVSANFYYQPKKQSSTEKAIQYYETRVQKSIKSSSSINMSKLDDSTMRLFFKYKHSSKGSEEYENKLSVSPFLYSIDGDANSHSVEHLVDIGLSSLILNRFLRLSGMKIRKFAFDALKSCEKVKEIRPALKKPVVSPKANASNNKKEVPQISWQLRVIGIGLEKLRMFFIVKNKMIWVHFLKKVKI